jgi:uncharacterized protein
MTIDVLWHSTPLDSVEHCTLARRRSGHRLSGVVVLPILERPAHLRYHVDVDPQWRTRTVDIRITSGDGERRIAVDTDGEGRWRVGGEPVGELDGCLDVDLGWTPSTNTLPIRRLGLEIGASESIRAAWVRFPEFAIEPAQQTYERLGAERWRYASGSFVADLDVDSEGLVLQYGADIWTAFARATSL